MRVRLKRWLRAASILLLLHTIPIGCSSSPDQQQGLEDLGGQEDAESMQQEGNLSNLEGEGNNLGGDDNFGNNNLGNEGNNFGNLGGGDNFANNEGGNAFANNEGLGNAAGNEGFANPQGNQFSNIPANQGGDGDLQEIIEEMNQAGTDQIASDPGMGNMATDPMMGNAAMGNFASDPMATGTTPGMATTGAAAAPGLPELGSKMSYIVQKGDTLVKIATKVYGDPSKWTELANFTGLANPKLIYPGDVVYYQLTEQSMAFAAAYESVKRSEVQIMEGDTLSTIASRVLGSPSNWKLIWRQNDNIDNPDRLKAGTTIYYVEPGMLSAAVDFFKDQFAKAKIDLNERQMIAKNSGHQNLNTQSVDSNSSHGSQLNNFDVDSEQFIQAEFGNAFAQVNQFNIVSRTLI